MPPPQASGSSLKKPGSETNKSRARRSSLFIHVSPPAIRHSVSIPASSRQSLSNNSNSRHNHNTPYSTSSLSTHMPTPSPTPAAQQTQRPDTLEARKSGPLHAQTRKSITPLFLAPTFSASSTSHNTSHPSHLSPRSLNRRQSIALQSSFSGNLPVAPLLHHPRPLTRPHTVYAQDLTADSACVSESVYHAQRERRRSMAYERYPPLGSIFEFRAEPSSPPSRTPCAKQGDADETDYFSSMHASSSSQRQQRQLLQAGMEGEALSDQWARQITRTSCGINRLGLNPSPKEDSDRLTANQQGHAGDFEFSNNADCSQGAKASRHASLASSLFSVTSFSSPSSSSSSSAASSYAYLFDRARPDLSLEVAPTDPANTACFSALASALLASAATTATDTNAATATAIATTAAVVPCITASAPRKRRYTAPVSFCAEISRVRAKSILFMIDNTMLVSPLSGQINPHGTIDSETAPLIQQRDHNNGLSYESGSQRQYLITAASTDMLEDSRLPTMAIVLRESRYIFSTSSHLLFGSVLQAVISMSQIASSGHLGRSELAGIGLAHVLVILTGYPVAFSVLSCLETCASQAFTSAHPRLVGGYFIRAIQTQWILGLVLGALWFSAEPLLAFIMHGTNPTSVAFATSYLRWYFVPFMVFANYLCAKQVLYAQGITYPLPYLTFLGAAVTLAGQYLFVFSPYFSLGVRGIALGNGLGYLAMLLATLWLIYRHNVSRIWGGLNVRAPWRPFLCLLPHCLVLSLFSTGTSELITMVATQLGTRSLATQAVLSTLSRMFMLTFSSIGVSALNRTGNLIGSRSIRGAKISANVSLLLGLLCAALSGTAMALSPGTWVRIFTNDEQVVNDATRILPMAILAFASQSLSFVGSQLLSAQGRQALAVRIKFVTLYAIGVPLGYYWAIASDHGLVGLWAAVAVGQLCTTVVETVVVLKTNWTRLIDQCTESIIIH
ncbi:ethionine resistance protein [Coemansia asiatica]|uniref:Ethionine resistance protein n=1 Tax=Coemansia asiatica TaxID=1052880 RepID=A0A9W7XH39_9FUNG|nr:ethionine resistance protein [Coemansia asiatica]